MASDDDFIGTSEAKGLLELKQDEFLDAYSAWRKKPDQENFEKLHEAAHKLRRVKPDFRFKVPASAQGRTTA